PVDQLAPLGLGGFTNSNSNGLDSDFFPSPWLDYASTEMPETMSLALRYCEYIFMSLGTYRQACDRVVSYFLTDIEISDAGDDDKEKWKTFLEETLDIRNMLHTVALDCSCYGNSFTSVPPIFKRYLACPVCSFEAPLTKVYNEPTFRFRWNDYTFHASCPKCKNSGRW